MVKATLIQVLVPLWLGLSGARADFAVARYVMALSSGGANEATLRRGEALNLDVMLSTRTGATHNSAIFRLVSSAPGLVYESYNWHAPYLNGTVDDDSKPLRRDLPAALSAATLQGPGYPANAVDLELSNVTGDDGSFGAGKLVSVALRVPADYTGPSTIEISAVPTALANGFDLEPTTAAGPFTLHVAPPPPAYSVSLSSGGADAATVVLGQTVTLDVALAATSGATHNSAILRLVSSAPGLVYESYNWHAPYRNGTLDDDSKPLLRDLPATLSAATLQGPGYPADAVDVELSNVTGDDGSFGAGNLVSVALRVPADYRGPSVIEISAVPTAIANGFELIPATAVGKFTITTRDTPPTVSIVSPGSGAVFYLGEKVGLAAEAADPGGAVVSVEFFDGANSLGALANAPYGGAFSLPEGSHTITAKATDNLGAATTSAPVNVVVAARPRILSWESLSGGEFRFTVAGTAGVRHVFESSPDLRNWVPFATNDTLGGSVTVKDTAASASGRSFYRAVVR